MTKELQEKGERFYQYTVIDEYTRTRYTWFTNEHSIYMSSEFVKRAVKYFSFKIKTIQIDNRFEFTNRLSRKKSEKTIFEATIDKLKKNGEVERSYRKDKERFYYKKYFIV